MKKILLATTILGMSTGFAAAEITWSASAAAGIASDKGYTYDCCDDEDKGFEVYSSMKIGVKGSGETDGGLTFSAEMDLTAGQTFERGDDLGDGFSDDSDAGFGDPTVSIGGAFGTISFSDGEFDSFGDNFSNDVKYVGTFGAVTLSAVADPDEDQYGVQLAYSADGLAVSVDVEEDASYSSYVYDYYQASVAYTMGAITGKISTDESEVTTVKLSYAADAISASIEMDDSGTDYYALTAGYTANGLTIGVETDSDEYTKVTGSYDLGAGLSLEAGADSEESAYLGAAMKF